MLLKVYNRTKIFDIIDEIRDEVEFLIECKGNHILGFVEKIETKDYYIVVTDFY